MLCDEIVRLACCGASLEKTVCRVCWVGRGGVGIRVDLSGIVSFGFLDAGSESVEDAAVLLLLLLLLLVETAVVGSGR